ncbi:hypothetical protein [[Mycoplasma] testudinis]|uniref:hypothetical protein n=1 Tax=[Mycoplasma] testudinis TaxID=33924 RepID=UPI000488077F|nr:hypothetical protein [[Mycoplasma] testudinis]
MTKKINKPPKFTEEKLAEILHYTDLDANPTFEAFKSNAFYKIYSGAKGVSKSFGNAIETIYRIVNEKEFCSVWCRNQYNHIKGTLLPMFDKVLDFLATVHGLDFNPYFEKYISGLYWNYNDGGEGRAIFFQNWESVQAFQGITLKKQNHRFGELVIDEPIEDPSDTKTHLSKLLEIYEIQKDKLPLLLANTVFRLKSPDGFKVNVKFLYNIFTTDHFLIQEYHNKVINLIDKSGQINKKNLNELIEKKFLQKYDADFDNGLGIIVTMYSKMFLPDSSLDEMQIKNSESLKKSNFRLWSITVAGFAFKEQNDYFNYYLQNFIFKPSGKIIDRTLPKNTDFSKLYDLGHIKYVLDGFDAGVSDNASWVRILLTVTGSIVVYDLVENLNSKNFTKKFRRTIINESLLNHIQESNHSLNLPSDFETNIFTDNDIIAENINHLMIAKKILGRCSLAIRKDTNSDSFGIINRQNWHKWILENNLLFFKKGTELLLHHLAKQVIVKGDEKRDETLNRSIYDLINAFEMACSNIYKFQFAMKRKELANV